MYLAVAAAYHDGVHATAIAHGRHLGDIDGRRLWVRVVLRRGSETDATFGAYRRFLAVLLHLEQVCCAIGRAYLGRRRTLELPIVEAASHARMHILYTGARHLE